MARALFGNSMTGLGHVVRTKSHAALLAQTCGAWSGTDESWSGRSAKRQLFWHSTCKATTVLGQAALA
jgi:hypothetical protein